MLVELVASLASSRITKWPPLEHQASVVTQPEDEAPAVVTGVYTYGQ